MPQRPSRQRLSSNALGSTDSQFPSPCLSLMENHFRVSGEMAMPFENTQNPDFS